MKANCLFSLGDTVYESHPPISKKESKKPDSSIHMMYGRMLFSVPTILQCVLGAFFVTLVLVKLLSTMQDK